MAAGNYGETLRRPGLQAFLWTQFLGAFNDSVCKIIVTFLTIRHFTAGLTAATDIVAAANSAAALAGAVFILPFLFFSGYAGHLADVISKRTVLIACKFLEIAIMAAMVPALTLSARGLWWPMLAVLFMMAVHSTFFSPAKYGIVPEALPAEDLSRANGLLEMTTFVAIVLGTSIGGEVFQTWHGEPWTTGAVLVAIAVAGTITSFGIPVTHPAKSRQRFSLNPLNEIGQGFARLARDRNLFMTVMGISFFWFLGALIQLTVLPFGQEELHVGEAASTRLFSALAVGIGFGSLVAGRLSGDRVELGLVPLGGFGMGIFSLLLVWAVPSYWLCAVALVLVGFAGGWFAVPLNALLQHAPGEDEKGRVLATNNVANTVGILLASAMLYVCGERMQMSGSQIIALGGVLSLLATAYLLFVLPDFLVRFFLWMLTHTVYRIKIVGRPHIPLHGPALIISNHVSMIDGALVGACVQRFVRFLVWGPYFRAPGISFILKRLKRHSRDGGQQGRSGTRHRAGARRSHRRTRGLHLRRGLGQPHRQPAEVQARLRAHRRRTRRADHSRLSRSRLGQRVQLQARQVLLEAPGAAAVPGDRRVWRAAAADDHGDRRASGAHGTRLRGHDAPAAAGGSAAHGVHARGEAPLAPLCDGRQHRADAHVRTGARRTRCCSAASSAAAPRDRSMVGLLLPASVGGAHRQHRGAHGRTRAREPELHHRRRSAVGGHRAGRDHDDHHVEAAFSRRPASPSARHGLPGGPPRRRSRPARRSARCWPRACCRSRSCCRRRGGGVPASSAATIIFSSGSTGVPKGVVLTHANILANVDGLAQIFPMERGDCFIGVLPFFHSFGFTGTLWFPLLQACPVAYHPNPMDAKTVGELAATYRATHADQHADVLPGLPAPLHARAIRAPQVRHRRRRETAASRWPRRSRSVRPDAARRLRLHGDVAGRRRQPPGRQRIGGESQIGHQVRIGRPSHSRRGGASRRSGHGRRADLRPARACCSSKARI